MKPLMRKQCGFTLVEVATVLVIIGLLLGGALKGQSMIENAKVKALAAEMRAVFVMLNTYRDVFKATPGDDEYAGINMPGATSANLSGAGDGAISTGEWVGREILTTLSESSLFWNHVRKAGLATGSSSKGFSNNALGGMLGITSSNRRPSNPPGAVGRFYVCSSYIPGRLARSLDLALDDGRGTTGIVFAAAETSGPVIVATAPADYSDDAIYTVCMMEI